MPSLEAQFRNAASFREFLAGIEDPQHPWQDFFDRALLHEDILSRALKLQGRWNLLAISEAWCGDGANSLPYLGRLAEAVPNLDLRLLSRDLNPELMDGHLTGGAQAIPVVLILDHRFHEVAWWGPRPAPLQTLFDRTIRALPQPERYPRLRAWYARDRGWTGLSEILDRIPEFV